jgi:hypothetical protein
MHLFGMPLMRGVRHRKLVYGVSEISTEKFLKPRSTLPT